MNTQLSQHTLILVADGETATLFANKTTGGSVSLEHKGKMSFDYLKEQGPSTLPNDMTDKGRGEATFARHIATDLYNRAHANGYSNLILIADPHTLGQLRPMLHQEVKNKLLLEIPKTLTNSTVPDVEHIVQKALDQKH